MKKREAFTLIELIAVLVILAILTLIVTTLVLNIIRKAKIAADRRSVDAYGRAVELAIATYTMDTGYPPTDLDNLEVEYTGKEVVCNIKQLKENGGLYMSECSVNGKEVKDSSSEDGYYHYGTRDLTNEEYIDMYGDALKKSSLKYLEDNGNIVSDYKTLNIDYTGKEVACQVTINYDGTIYLENCSVAGTSVPDKTYGEIVNPPAAQSLIGKANAVSVTNYNDGNTSEMYTFEHSATTQTGALTDYRYIGNEPNNYVTFNNETWRIIGVFTTENSEGNTEQRIKLIRGEKLPSDMAWDTNNVNEWTTATLNIYLNEDYYNSLTNNAKNMIDSVKYYLGANNKLENLGGSDYYNNERGTTVYSRRSTNWIGKIALMYPSDYVYTYALGVDNTCYTEGYNCETYSKGNPSYGWIFNTNGSIYQVALTTYSNYNYRVFGVNSKGFVNHVDANLSRAVRPVLYLKSNIQIESGDGTEGSPYVFKL